jgi:hypothetical protein
MYRVDRGEVAGVKRVVALLHEREQVRGPIGRGIAGRLHDFSFWRHYMVACYPATSTNLTA